MLRLLNANLFSRRDHLDLLIPGEGRPAVPQRVHHQRVLPVFFGRHGHRVLGCRVLG